MRSFVVASICSFLAIPILPEETPKPSGFMIQLATAIGEGSGGMGNTVTIDNKAIRTTNQYVNGMGVPIQATAGDWDPPIPWDWPWGIRIEVRRRSFEAIQFRMTNSVGTVDSGWQSLGGAGNQDNGWEDWQASVEEPFWVWNTKWETDKTDWWNCYRRSFPLMTAPSAPFVFDNRRFYSQVLASIVFNSDGIVPAARQVIRGPTRQYREGILSGNPPSRTLIETYAPNGTWDGTSGSRYCRWDGEYSVYGGQFVVLGPSGAADDRDRIIAGVFFDAPIMVAHYTNSTPPLGVAGVQRLFQDMSDQGGVIAEGELVTFASLFSHYFRIGNNGTGAGTALDQFLFCAHWGPGWQETVGNNIGDTTAASISADLVCRTMGLDPWQVDLGYYNSAVTNGVCDFTKSVNDSPAGHRVKY